jgi:mandelate racemase
MVMRGGEVRVSGVDACPVVVPLDRPIRTASGTIGEAPLLLLDLHTDAGVTGRAYLFGFQAATLAPLQALVRALAAAVQGDPLAPLELDRTLRARFALLGTRGLLGMALSGLDTAAWDAAAHAAGLPLVRLLGGAPRPVRAYLGNGIGVIPVAEVAETAARLAAEGLPGMKIRLGRPAAGEDVAAVRAARRALPDGVALLADFNQSLSVAEAIRRGQALDEEGLGWIEEPVRADDFRGAAQVAAAVRTPIQLGENLASAFEMHEALRAGAADVLMADAQQIGGVTGWLRAAALAHAHGVPLSSHLFQEVSAHLLPLSPTADWLEYMSLADPILAEPLRPVDGALTAPARPGIGLAWDDAAVRRYRIA